MSGDPLISRSLEWTKESVDCVGGAPYCLVYLGMGMT